MINPNFFLGLPVEFGKICTVYPPKIKDILSEVQYPYYRKLLLTSQEEIEDEFTEQNIKLDQLPTPLEYLFVILSLYPDLEEVVKKAFLFFIKEPVTLLKDKQIIVIGDLNIVLQTISSIKDLRILNNDNFFEFQNLLRLSIGEKEGSFAREG